MTPKFPIIVQYESMVDVIPDPNGLGSSSVYGILKGKDGNLAYDASGQKWKYWQTSEKVQDNILTRFLANTFYNPEVEVSCSWELIGKYELSDLKEFLNECVDADDDLLTQFVEGDYLKTAINSCQTFGDIYETLNKYVFDANEEEIWDEQGMDYKEEPKGPVKFNWKLFFVLLTLSPTLLWLALKLGDGILTFIVGTVAVFMAVGIWIMIETYFKEKKNEKTTANKT